MKPSLRLRLHHLAHLGRLCAAAALAASAAGMATAAGAAPITDPASCRLVKMADPGWTDIAATNALTGIVLEALGYEQRVMPLSVPITYAGMKKAQVDVFLGNWMPAQSRLVTQLLNKGVIEQLHANLPAAKFTLAVPNYVAKNGVRTFSDLAHHADKFDRKIYGIETGAPANQTVRKMLADKAYGLDGWSIVESSEQGMLSQVARKQRSNEWIVFLAWEPNQMNNTFQLTYLDGDKDYFGPNFGSGSVHTVTRRGYRAACPNLGRLFSQIEFNTALEHAIIADIVHKRPQARPSALRQLQAHPELINAWLTGVTTLDGRDGAAALRARLAQP
ncbi:choline ABC transporter substrate-binding protein [Duganella sp. FT80W]|uniref:Choline ABC transporter substrate-binding protein n=1 Tax=Duganella guangzhouensis TaxID=2666084 RepID=A0A6I2L1S3_9BURK|nr:choline ABC transporter substrate-binding protein [Duganella guangzhouensis]MRW91680.1 choline ABC transporter substrate-binding protein [Duganella guangzhouensis]